VIFGRIVPYILFISLAAFAVGCADATGRFSPPPAASTCLAECDSLSVRWSVPRHWVLDVTMAADLGIFRWLVSHKTLALRCGWLHAAPDLR